MRFGGFAFAALCASLAVPALAVDGVREINQICATTTGCFPGDLAGYPVTITESGSYRLTGNLSQLDATLHFVLVSAPEVTIDLNGHRIFGPAICTQIPPVSCSSTGSGRGITVDVDNTLGLVVRNGSVRGAGGEGVFTGQLGQVENVSVASSGGSGIRVGAHSLVQSCRAFGNGGRGIQAPSNAVVEGSVVSATGSGMAGIDGGSGMIVRGNRVTGAAGDGIHTQGGELVIENKVSGSGGHGIRVGTQARVAGNSVTTNTGSGIDFGGTGGGYADNVLAGNGAFVTTPAGNVNLGGNACNGALCP